MEVATRYTNSGEYRLPSSRVGRLLKCAMRQFGESGQYSIEKLGEFLRFSDALAVVESADNPNAVGDGGRAYGRWQMHPAWVVMYRAGVLVSDTWDAFLTRALRQFFDLTWKYERDLDFELRRIAMEFHVGHAVVPSDQDWDQKYDEKFSRALEQATTKRASAGPVV